MATFYGYVILIVGLSLLLGLAGVETTTGKVLGLFVSVTPTSPTGNFTVATNNFHTNPGGTWFLVSLAAIIGTFALVGGVRASLGGVFGVAETIKATGAAVIFSIMVADFVALLAYVNGINSFGGITRIVTLVVYVPIAIGSVISSIDWIGGGR